MKRIFTILLLLLPIVGFSQKSQPFTDEEKKEIELALYMVDNANPDGALEIYKKLEKRYPKNYDLCYEMAYAYSVKGEFQLALKMLNRVKDSPEADERFFHMLGNTYDYLQNPKKSLKTYAEGLKRFPKSGILYLEQGNVYHNLEKYDEALQSYEMAMCVQPDYSTSYYRAAQLLSNSTEKVWALLYAEVYRLLELNGERSEEMSKLIYETLLNSIHVKSDSVMEITLTERNIYLPTTVEDFSIPLSIYYEASAQNACSQLSKLGDDVQMTSIDILSCIRDSAAISVYEMSNMYPVSLIDYLHKVKEAGHWEAYNYWLLGMGNQEEARSWLKTHESELEELAKWISLNPFIPSESYLTVRTKSERKLRDLKALGL